MSDKKVGRNDPCPCGSGLKYKKCCLALEEPEVSKPGETQQDAIISDEIKKLQSRAARKKKTFKLLGAFIFFATTDGDAWLLELTEKDALVLAKGGELIETEVKETEETLEINWTHSFKVTDSNFITTSYLDKSEEAFSKYPAKMINDTLKQMFPDYSV